MRFALLLFLAACLPAFAQTYAVRVTTNGVPAAGDLIIWSGSDWVKLNRGTNGQVLTSTGSSIAWSNAASGGGSGSVASVGLSLPSIFTVSGTPVTDTGTLTGTLATQAANRLWAGPTTGADAAPTFRAVVDDDIPNTITIDLAAVATVANSGDSATAFFSSGTIEDARIDSAIARDSEVTAATAEATLEAVLDLQDLQGAVTDAQVPNTITVDLAAVATTANAGDSATAFFSSGTVEDARIDSAITRDAEAAAAYQPLATRLTRLAAGVQSLSYSTTNIALDASAGTHFRVALTNLVGLECQLSNPTGGVDGDQITVELIQSGSGGSVISLGSKWTGGYDIFIPTSNTWGQITNASTRDFIRAVYNATTDKWYVIGLPRGY